MMNPTKVLLAFLCLFQSQSKAFEIFEKSQNRLVGVKWCEPTTGKASDSVSFIPCVSQTNEKVPASKGSSCTNYQADGCGQATDAPIVMTGDKGKPWNFFDKSNPEQAAMRPTSQSPTGAKSYEVWASSVSKKKKPKKQPDKPEPIQ